MTSTELTTIDKFSPASPEAADLWREEMQGEEVEFPTVTTPKAGGTTWEVEGEDPTRELEGVVIDDYVEHVVYLNAYDPANPSPPDAYWIAGELQYITDEARKAGYNEQSHIVRGHLGADSRQVLFLARPGNIVPLKVSVSGPSCRPWKLFKQNQIVGRGLRVTDVAVALGLETRKYQSGHTGSVIVPRLLGTLPKEAAQAFYAQRDQMRPFTRPQRTAPAAGGETGGSLADEFAAQGLDFDAPELL